jgi:hypothetical protein
MIRTMTAMTKAAIAIVRVLISAPGPEQRTEPGLSRTVAHSRQSRSRGSRRGCRPARAALVPGADKWAPGAAPHLIHGARGNVGRLIGGADLSGMSVEELEALIAQLQAKRAIEPPPDAVERSRRAARLLAEAGALDAGDGDSEPQHTAPGQRRHDEDLDSGECL